MDLKYSTSWSIALDVPLIQQDFNSSVLLQIVDHPRAVANPDIVRMDNFYSMWRSRTVPCPKGSDRPACETVLLHHEQFKIPENLARFAVRHGMAGFLKRMGPEVQQFVAERRQRCGPVCALPFSTPEPPKNKLAATCMDFCMAHTISTVCG